MNFKNTGLQTILKKIQVLGQKKQGVSTRSINNVSQILNIDLDQEIIIRNYFLSKGIPVNRHDQLFDHLVKSYTEISEIKKISNPDINSSIILSQRDEFYLDHIFTGYSRSFLQSILSYRWAGSPTIGAGEIFLTLSIFDAVKPIRGDIFMSGLTHEIKCNSSRLRGQSYCLDTQEICKVINNKIRLIKIKFNISSNELQHILDDTSFNKYNLNKSNFSFFAAFKIMYNTVNSIANKKYVLKEFYDIISKILMIDTFTDSLTYKFLQSKLIVEFKSNEILSKEFYKQFVINFALDSFKRYFKEEKIDGSIIFINTSTLKCLIINKDNLLEHIDKFSFSMPSLSVKSGPQGSSLGVTLN